MPTAPLPKLMTTGEAAALAGCSIRTIQDWTRTEPSLIAYDSKLGRLLFADRFTAFLARRGPPRPPRPRPPTAAREGGPHAAE
jgi:hypothetical protein